MLQGNIRASCEVRGVDFVWNPMDGFAFEAADVRAKDVFSSEYIHFGDQGVGKEIPLNDVDEVMVVCASDSDLNVTRQFGL